MSDKKIHIEKNSTQETLVIPLYARKLCTDLYPSIFKDTRAVKLIDSIDYDFSSIEKKADSFVQRFGALEIAMRQNDLQIEVEEYLKEHPYAAVINVGCGLDETGESCDNGKCKIYNLDMPDVIDARNALIPAQERVKNIGCDLNDTSWFDKIDDEDGSVFFASGVFYYFKIEEMQKLINAMAERFKGGKLVFDITGKAGLKMVLKVVAEEAGIKNVGGFFHIDSIEKDVMPWIKNAKVSSKPYMYGYSDLKDPCIPALFRLISKFSDNVIKMQIMRFDFN